MLSLTRMYCCAYFLHRMSERLYHNIIVITMNVCDCHMKDHWGTGQLCFYQLFYTKKNQGSIKTLSCIRTSDGKYVQRNNFFYIYILFYILHSLCKIFPLCMNSRGLLSMFFKHYPVWSFGNALTLIEVPQKVLYWSITIILGCVQFKHEMYRHDDGVIQKKYIS